MGLDEPLEHFWTCGIWFGQDLPNNRSVSIHQEVKRGLGCTLFDRGPKTVALMVIQICKGRIHGNAPNSEQQVQDRSYRPQGIDMSTCLQCSYTCNVRFQRDMHVCDIHVMQCRCIYHLCSMLKTTKQCYISSCVCVCVWICCTQVHSFVDQLNPNIKAPCR